MKRIPLSQGKFTLVDNKDFLLLNDAGVKIYFDGNYACFEKKINNKIKKIYLHRFLLDVPKNLFTDHINGNSLDNRRSNLRICTMTQNNQNTRLSVDNTSGFKGVGYLKSTKKWRAYITKNSKQIFLGTFFTKKKAALAYNVAAKQYFGEFARLNTF